MFNVQESRGHVATVLADAWHRPWGVHAVRSQGGGLRSCL